MRTLLELQSANRCRQKISKRLSKMCEGPVVKIKYLLLASISGSIIAFDQLTKLYIHAHFHLGELHTVIPNFFDITYVRNFGAAFGIFASSAQWFREPFFNIVP